MMLTEVWRYNPVWRAGLETFTERPASKRRVQDGHYMNNASLLRSRVFVVETGDSEAVRMLMMMITRGEEVSKGCQRGENLGR